MEIKLKVDIEDIVDACRYTDVIVNNDSVEYIMQEAEMYLIYSLREALQYAVNKIVDKED